MAWLFKMALKAMLARSGLARGFLNRLGMFRHGNNAEAGYAYNVFQKHFQIANPLPGFTCLEMGPGESLASAILTKAFGGGRSFQVDVDYFASRDIQVYRAISDFAVEKGRARVTLADCETLNDVLVRCDAHYLTNGLASFAEIPTASVDFIYSHAVLEHIRTHEFAGMMGEIRRVLKPGGVATHRVDLKDHLTAALNNLRFPDAIWERPFVVNSGFYTNRMSFGEIIAAMKAAGLTADVSDVSRWEQLPTPRKAMARQFQTRSDDELSISAFSVVCRPI